MKHLLAIIFLGCALLAHSQVVIQGIVITDDNIPLDYAVVNITDSANNTLASLKADEQGYFKVNVTKTKSDNYTLIISSMGHREQTFPIALGSEKNFAAEFAFMTYELKNYGGLFYIPGAHVIKDPGESYYFSAQAAKDDIKKAKIRLFVYPDGTINAENLAQWNAKAKTFDFEFVLLRHVTLQLQAYVRNYNHVVTQYLTIMYGEKWRTDFDKILKIQKNIM